MKNDFSFEKLRASFPYFIFEKYQYSFIDNDIIIEFDFNLSGVYSFKPLLRIPKRNFYHELTSKQWDILVFHIGMIELISYWKAACSPKIIIKPFILTNDQINWFKKLYFHGLGEFFFLNKIETNEIDFVDIICETSNTIEKQNFITSVDTIVPIGGGKDSVVTLEILLKNNVSVTPMIINPRKATIDCIEVAGYKREQIIEVQRTICPQLLKLNEQGFLNGHTPFSAMLAFVSLLTSALSQKRYTALSNEGSANESTVQNSTVNHQYSKSYEFEYDFRGYVQKYITNDIQYFSFLRPLSELQIASLFAKNPKYFPVFRSCNVGSKTDIWCGSCPKCLFAYIILSPFIDPDKMQKIFGKDMLNELEMQFYFNQLTGIEETKPFECVGTIDEVNAALVLTTDTFYKSGNKPFLLKNIEVDGQKLLVAKNMLSQIDEKHFLEPRFLEYLLTSLKN